MSIYKKGIRSYSKGIWQLKILCDDQLYYIKAVSKQEAEEKYNCLLKGYKKFSRPISLTGFDCYLKQSGFPAGTERVLVKRKKKSAHKLSSGSWRSSFTYNKTRIYLIGASEKEAEKKMLITRNAVEQGLCEGTLEGAHEYLVNAGYEFGRFSSKPKKPKPQKRKHGSFHNNIRERSNGTFEGRYRFNGKTESIYGSSKVEVKNHLTTIQAAILNGSFVGKNTETLTGFLMHWLNISSQEGLSPATEASYRAYIMNHILPTFEHVRIQQIDGDMLQEFFNNKRISGRIDGKEGGLGYKTMKNIKNMLSRAFDYALYKGIIAKNPVNMVRLKAEKGKSTPILDFQEADTFLHYCLNSEDPFAWGVAILLKTGMRIGELCGLRFEYIDLEKRQIHIQRSLRRIQHPNKHQANDYELINTWGKKDTKTGLYLGPPKTESSKRTLQISDIVLECIHKLISFQEELLGHPLSECAHKGEKNFLLINPLGRAVDPRTFHDHFKKFLEESGLHDIKIHSTRHTWITHAITRFPEELANISALAGHSSQETTLKYNHANENKQAELMNKL